MPRARKKSQKSKKEIIELERYKKKKILIKYAKLCAAEGIQSARMNIACVRSHEKGKHLGDDLPQHNKSHENKPLIQDFPKTDAPQIKKRQRAITSKGQPVMSKQISHLLSKIQKNFSES